MTHECFRDPAYFDMWCVRAVGNKVFGDGFHVATEAEAIHLRDTLAAVKDVIDCLCQHEGAEGFSEGIMENVAALYQRLGIA